MRDDWSSRRTAGAQPPLVHDGTAIVSEQGVKNAQMAAPEAVGCSAVFGRRPFSLSLKVVVSQARRDDFTPITNELHENTFVIAYKALMTYRAMLVWCKVFGGLILKIPVVARSHVFHCCTKRQTLRIDRALDVR